MIPSLPQKLLLKDISFRLDKIELAVGEVFYFSLRIT